MSVFRASDYASHHNEIVVVHQGAIGRLVGIHTDIYDAYYVIHHRGDTPGCDPVVRYYSAAGACDLARYDPNFQYCYDRLELMHTQFGAPPTPNFTVTRHMKEYQNYWYFGDDFG